MTRNSSSASEKRDGALPFGPLEGLTGTLTDALNHNRSIVENAAQTLSGEMLRFIGRRFEHTGQVIETCSACKSIPELLSAQQKWLADAVRDYIDEGLRLGETIQRVALEGSRPPVGRRSQTASRGTETQSQSDPARLRA